jgi:membrane-associated phospholipid phosphatase
VVRAEIEELQMLMQDDRDRYLAEIEMQADGLADYVIHFLAADRGRHPWTVELISCGLAIGNIAYMSYKQQFGRVRASFLCPGLIPPFGPPGHPSFPSGHSFLGHLIALLLLEIPALAARYGIFPAPAPAGSPGQRPAQTSLAGRGELRSPLLWLAQRLAKNRERLGVHYISDSMGSRHLAAGIWWALLHEPSAAARIVCPSLQQVLIRASAEWPSI